jgi:hypothetical protein
MADPSIGRVGDGPISLFEFALEIVDEMPADAKESLSQLLFFLMACAEGDTLNMDKLAELVNKLSDGRFHFPVDA